MEPVRERVNPRWTRRSPRGSSATADGLVPAVAQQYDTGEVLMLGWMDDEALHRTLTTGRCTYWSRSRGEYWVKGETSGHQQWVKSVALDCDGDTVLVRVDQVGAACHTGDRTCFDAAILDAVTGDRSAASMRRSAQGARLRGRRPGPAPATMTSAAVIICPPSVSGRIATCPRLGGTAMAGSKDKAKARQEVRNL